MNIRPLHDYVIIRSEQEAHLSKGGIVIPDKAAEKPGRGEVLAVGNGSVRKDGTVVPMTVKSGDSVLFGKYTGTEFKYSGEKLLLMHEADILAVLESES